MVTILRRLTRSLLLVSSTALLSLKVWIPLRVASRLVRSVVWAAGGCSPDASSAFVIVVETVLWWPKVLAPLWVDGPSPALTGLPLMFCNELSPLLSSGSFLEVVSEPRAGELFHFLLWQVVVVLRSLLSSVAESVRSFQLEFGLSFLERVLFVWHFPRKVTFCVVSILLSVAPLKYPCNPLTSGSNHQDRTYFPGSVLIPLSGRQSTYFSQQWLKLFISG
jgi:hypothetical protein